MKSTRGVLGHSLLRSLVRSHRSLIRLLRTARCARALRCTHSFARSLTRSLRSSWERDLCQSIECVDIMQFQPIVTCGVMCTRLLIGERSESKVPVRETDRGTKRLVKQRTDAWMDKLTNYLLKKRICESTSSFVRLFETKLERIVRICFSNLESVFRSRFIGFSPGRLLALLCRLKVFEMNVVRYPLFV